MARAQNTAPAVAMAATGAARPNEGRITATMPLKPKATASSSAALTRSPSSGRANSTTKIGAVPPRVAASRTDQKSRSGDLGPGQTTGAEASTDVHPGKKHLSQRHPGEAIGESKGADRTESRVTAPHGTGDCHGL